MIDKWNSPLVRQSSASYLMATQARPITRTSRLDTYYFEHQQESNRLRDLRHSVAANSTIRLHQSRQAAQIALVPSSAAPSRYLRDYNLPLYQRVLLLLIDTYITARKTPYDHYSSNHGLGSDELFR